MYELQGELSKGDRDYKCRHHNTFLPLVAILPTMVICLSFPLLSKKKRDRL